MALILSQCNLVMMTVSITLVYFLKQVHFRNVVLGYVIKYALNMVNFYFQIENLQEQLRDKDKQLTNLKDRVKSLQTDSSNTDTALATLEEALSEKVSLG